MDVEIEPEPSEAERAAILAALEQERAERAAFVSEIAQTEE